MSVGSATNVHTSSFDGGDDMIHFGGDDQARCGEGYQGSGVSVILCLFESNCGATSSISVNARFRRRTTGSRDEVSLVYTRVSCSHSFSSHLANSGIDIQFRSFRSKTLLDWPSSDL